MIPKSSDLIVTDVRDLLEEEIPLISANPLGSTVNSVTQMRTSHHNLAMLMAQGRSNAEISQITGYSPSWISNLKNQDPAFQELLTHYFGQREAVLVDTLERLKILGLSSLDELQNQLEENPKGWSKRELMELAELGLIKGRVGAAGAAGGNGGSAPGPGVSLNIQFVEPAPGKTIDVKAG